MTLELIWTLSIVAVVGLLGVYLVYLGSKDEELRRTNPNAWLLEVRMSIAAQERRRQRRKDAWREVLRKLGLRR